MGGRSRWYGVHVRRTRLPASVALACLAIAASAALIETDPLAVLLDCVLGWTLLALAWIDWERMLLPDALTLPLVLAGLGATTLLDAEAATEHAAAAASGYLAFRAIELGYHQLRGRDGLGQGDAKLMAAAGAWLGLAPLPMVAFTAAALGLAIAAGLRLAGRVMDGGSVIPLGPALCAAIWTARLGVEPTFWGQP